MSGSVLNILRPFLCPHSFAIQASGPVDPRPPTGGGPGKSPRVPAVQIDAPVPRSMGPDLRVLSLEVRVQSTSVFVLFVSFVVVPSLCSVMRSRGG